MDDLIKREDAIKAVWKPQVKPNELIFDALKTAIESEINNVPSADRPSGEWIPCTKSGLTLTELMRREGQKWYGYRCSNCNHIYKGNALTDCNFCCKCGARMKGADDE